MAGREERVSESGDSSWVVRPVRQRLGEHAYKTDVDELEFFRVLRVFAVSGACQRVRHRTFKLTQTGRETYAVEGDSVRCVTRSCDSFREGPGVIVYRESEARLHNGAFVSADIYNESCAIEQLECAVDRNTRLVFEVKKYDDGSNFFGTKVLIAPACKHAQELTGIYVKYLCELLRGVVK